jgi:hypothetical protein
MPKAFFVKRGLMEPGSASVNVLATGAASRDLQNLRAGLVALLLQDLEYGIGHNR